VFGLHTVYVGDGGFRTLNSSPLFAVLVHVFRLWTSYCKSESLCQ